MRPGELDVQYFKMADDILEYGREKGDRTGTGTLSLFGNTSIRVNLSDMSIPFLTTKKIAVKTTIHELIWFLSGVEDANYLIDNKVTIWHGDLYKKYTNYLDSVKDLPLIDSSDVYKSIVNPDLTPLNKEQFKEGLANKNSTLRHLFSKTGPIYGSQWRSFGKNENFKGIDQIKNLLDLLKNDPDSRRLKVSAWNPVAIKDMLLPPCHTDFQCNTFILTDQERINFAKVKGYNLVSESKEELDSLDIPVRGLDLWFSMRSNDFCLGNPINIASYGILLHIFAHLSNMMPNNLIATYGDAHIYKNHIESLKEQLERDPYLYKYPTIEINKNIKNIDDLTIDDITIHDYESYPTIKFELSN